MKNYVYYMLGDARSPVSTTLTMEDWFRGYKWKVEGEVFVPVPVNIPTTQLVSQLVPGDRLWFALHEQVVGYSSVLRVELYALGDYHEVWYDGASCQSVRESALCAMRLNIEGHFCLFETTDEAANFWLSFRR